ncbi:hypothetical protein LJC23_03445 [Desulfovibrio sp. OttesenSCG-928-I05]|nr:hypothetical protein [Desulfovibrio sp. OttesenSCG-928-I05]
MRPLIFFLCVFLLVPGAFTAHAAEGPASSVAMLQKAIDGMDTDLLEKYLDIPEVTRKNAQYAVELLEKNPSLRKEAQKSPVLAFAMMSLGSKGASEALAALVAHEAQSFVHYGVASGAFAGKPGSGKNPGDPGLLFAPLLKGDERDVKRFDDIRVLEQSGDTARIAASLYDGTRKKSYPLELEATRRDGIWRITDVLNREKLAALPE